LHKPGRYAFSLGIIGGGRRPLGCGDRTRLGVLRDLRQRRLRVSDLEASPSATAAESVAFQDHGAYPEFFERAGQSPWRVVGSAPGPPGVMDCATFKDLPSRLRVIWGDCVLTPSTTTTTLAPWCVTLMADAFIQAQSVVVTANGTATVKGLALEVQCAPGTRTTSSSTNVRRASRPRRCTWSRVPR